MHVKMAKLCNSIKTNKTKNLTFELWGTAEYIAKA
jgi:hypothetical protein